MKFDDIVHFTGGRTVCPPATHPIPLRPLSKIKTAAAGHPPQAPRVIIVVRASFGLASIRRPGAWQDI